MPPSLQRLSEFLDSSIRLPGGYRIGWDGIIGLLPGIGDLAGLAISLYIMGSARRAGATLPTLLRMLFNVGLEMLIGTVPILGDLFDLAFKANNRNMQLLHRQTSDAAALNRTSRNYLWVLIIAAIVMVLSIGYLAVNLLLSILGWLL